MSGELQEIINLVREAGEKVLEIYQDETKVHRKKDKTPVTEADLISEKIILSALREYGYGILSEEKEDTSSRLKEDKIWIVDPLDGTQDFLQKTDDFSIMVGLAREGKSVLGVVYKPVGDKVYFAQEGKGAFLKEPDEPLRKLKVSGTFSLPDAHFVFSRSHIGKLEKEFIRNSKTKGVTCMGSTGLKLGFIAEGKADGYFTISNKTSQWDICAPEIILREAGGKVTNKRGKEFTYNRREVRNLQGIVASNRVIHEKIIEKLQQK